MNEPLKGLRVLNTRPMPQGKRLTQIINHLGGVAIECPALMIEDIPFTPPSDLSLFNHAIFVSANAVTHCFDNFIKENITWPSSIHTLAIGQSTADALVQYKVKHIDIPQESTSESLLTLASLEHIQGQHILLVKGQGGRHLIEDTLSQRHAFLTRLEVYKRIKPKLNQEYLFSLWQQDAVDIILYTSEEALQNTFAMFGESAYPWLCKTACLVISQRLANTAKSLGVQHVIVAAPNAIVDALHHFNQGRIHAKPS